MPRAKRASSRGKKAAPAPPPPDPREVIPGYDPAATAPAGAWFDAEQADAACGFIEGCVTHVEGAMAGQPFRLEPWQRAIVRALFGWMVTDSLGRPVRRYRECLLYVPRKNGKTPLAAAIALLVLFCDEEAGQQNYVAAASREQAGMLFRQAKGMVENEPEMARRCEVYGGRAEAGQSRSIVRSSDGSFLRVISADGNTKHGGNPHLVLIDELHAQPNPDLVTVLTTSMASANRAESLLMLITTADYMRPSVCNDRYEYACRVRDGIIADPAFLPVVYEIAREADWTAPEVWAKANPNLGVSVSLDYLRRECLRARENPAYANEFRRLHLNQRTETAIRAIDMAAWDDCPAFDEADLLGRECHGGLDLSTKTDLSAFALAFRVGGLVVLKVWFWAPAERARERSRADRVPYELWAEQGYIKLTPGAVVDYDVIRADINDIAKRYDLKSVGADRWNATQIITQLTGDGLAVVAFGQGYASMSSPTKDLLADVVSRKLVHNANPVLRWMASLFAVEQDAAGNLKPSKAKSSDRIDGMVAAVMACGRQASEGDASSMYETQGLTIL